MKKFILLAAAAVAFGTGLQSCTQDEEKGAALNDGSIQFDTYMGRPGSRAAATTSANLANFGVFAFTNGTNAYASNTKPNFMYNQKVDKSGTSWVYTPLKYWPANPAEKVSFIAYSPFTENPAAMTGGASGLIGMSANTLAGDPTINFEVGKDITKQIDLVYGKALDKTNTSGTVNFDMKHALSRVVFKVVGWEPVTGETFDDKTTVVINSVKLTTTRKSATLNLNTGAWSNPSNTAATSPIGFKIATSNNRIQNNTIIPTDTEKLLNLDNEYIMMFPDLSGSGNDEYFLFVDYTVTTLDSKLDGGKIVKRNNVYRSIKPNFQAGKAYTITIHLGMNGYSGPDDGTDPATPPTEPDPEAGAPGATPVGDGDYIYFSASVTEWDGTGNLVTVPLAH